MGGHLEGRNGGRKGGLLIFAAVVIWAVALSGTGAGKGLSVHPFSPSGEPRVASTLVLLNNTLLPGHFVAANGLGPVGVAYDSDKSEVFVASYSRNTVSVISDKTNTLVANIPMTRIGFCLPRNAPVPCIFIRMHLAWVAFIIGAAGI